MSSVGIRGSVEKGEKAWTAGSSIVGWDLVSLTAGRDTVLDAALLHATDGDILIDTRHLTVSDKTDIDTYSKIGGSIGFDGAGLKSIGFSYEKRDKRGVTRATLDAAGELTLIIRDADGDGVEDTDADRQATEALLASINRDADTWQEITKDSHTKLSGELDVEALLELTSDTAQSASFILLE